MKICVAYIYGENYFELAKIAIPVLMKYCLKHNYDFRTKSCKPNDNGRYDFIRIQYANDLLSHYDACLILEGDMLVTSMNYKIEDLLEGEKDFYLCKDINGVNTASFICRSTKWMRELLTEIYTHKDKLWDEQIFFETFEHEKIKYLNHPSINSLPYDCYAPTYGYIDKEKQIDAIKPTHEEGCWQPGDFILHCPGMELSKRIEIFKNHLKDIVW